MNKFFKTSIILTAFLLLLGPVYSNDKAPIEDPAAENGSGWALYSEGLLYKNQAQTASNVNERNDLLEKAVDKFKKAIEAGDRSGRVYHQLADSYFLKGNADLAVEYAQKAVKSSIDFFPPYNLLYGIKMSRKEFESAAEIMEKYHSINPEDPYTLYLLGVHYFKYLNDPDKSLDAFQKVIFLSGTAAMPSYYLENSYYNCGYILYTKNEFKEALDYFKKSYELNENNTTALYMAAVSAMNYYNLDDAEKHALLFMKVSPGNPNMAYVLGRLYYIKGDAAAFQYLSMVKDSNSFEGLLTMALYSELTGEDEKAEKILTALVKHRSDFISPYIALGRIKARQDDKEGAYNAFITAGTNSFRNGLFNAAEKLFYRSMELQLQENPDIYYYLARTHEENKNFALAISYYKKYYEHSGELNIVIHIGYLYASRGQYEKAHEYYAEAEKIDNKNSSVYFFRGLTYIWQENYKKGEASLRKAISLNDGEEGYYFYLAVALEKQDRFNDTVNALEKAIEINPQSARSLNYLGYLYAVKNINIEEAYRLVNLALAIEPGNGAYLDSLGWIYYRKGDYEQALTNLLLAEEKLAETESPDFVVFDHIGDTYKKLGNERKALFYWGKAFELEKSSSIEEKIKKASKNGEK
jgi:tetratricopeptide (TPR) repeat protein